MPRAEDAASRLPGMRLLRWQGSRQGSRIRQQKEPDHPYGRSGSFYTLMRATKKPLQTARADLQMAERVGFEPTVAINHT